MQVANDAASAKELPSREARPGRRVSNSAAGKLQGGELREDCVEGALRLGPGLNSDSQERRLPGWRWKDPSRAWE